MTTQTILIGLDGATFAVLDGLMRDGVMPFLRDFVASGVRAELRSVVPALTPPAWTSLMTGRSPGQHGIFDFFRKEAPQSQQIRILTGRDVACETIWSLVSRQGMRATVLNFPSMCPPPPIDGYVVAGWMPWRQLRLGCYPADLYDRLKALPGFDARELAMDMSMEEKAIEGCRLEEYEDWIALHIRREQRWLAILSALMREDPCELTAILFDGVDKLQHLCWRFLDPAYLAALPAGELERAQRIRERCLDYYRHLDGIIAEIVRMAGPEATVLLASDHGFGPQTGAFFVNTWLEQRGYLAWAAGKAPMASEEQMVGIGQLARHVYLLDWERTLAYAPLPSGNGIHIVTAGPGNAHGIPAAEYEQFRARLIEELRSFRDPATGQPVVAQVWTREQLFAGPAIDLAPDLTLVLQDGGLVSIMASDVPFKRLAAPRGTHRPEGILIGRGPGLRRGASLPQLAILDVAPLILYSLGLPIPPEMEGRVPTEALEPESLRQRPVQTDTRLELAVNRAQEADEPPLDAEGEAEILRRLQALGYLE